jgi:stearoyl-CoA desaturase (delta-9 desaturase)
MALKIEFMLGFIAIHAIAALALVPWFFSWTGVMLLIVGYFVFGLLGINLGFHRLLAHRGFSCPLWLERTLAILGVCALQDSPALWVARHRRHHNYADEERDPHSPAAGFLWAHCGWLLVRRRDLRHEDLIADYAGDVVRDPLLGWLEKNLNWSKVVLASWAAYFAAGYAAALLTGATTLQAVQFGASLLVWGAALRTVMYWHMTWAVNSASHKWGYRNYPTPDDSRNNAIVALLAHGEGWHNNHHADPRSARHGHQWWEIDTTWLVIRLLARLGLFTDVALPAPKLIATMAAGAAPPSRRVTAAPAPPP